MYLPAWNKIITAALIDESQNCRSSMHSSRLICIENTCVHPCANAASTIESEVITRDIKVAIPIWEPPLCSPCKQGAAAKSNELFSNIGAAGFHTREAPHLKSIDLTRVNRSVLGNNRSNNKRACEGLDIFCERFSAVFNSCDYADVTALFIKDECLIHRHSIIERYPRPSVSPELLPLFYQLSLHGSQLIPENPGCGPRQSGGDDGSDARDHRPESDAAGNRMLFFLDRPVRFSIP